MYMVSVYVMHEPGGEKHLLGTAHYREYEHALGDIVHAEPNLVGCIPEWLRKKTDFANPRINFGSADPKGNREDASLVYPGGLFICITSPIFEDDYVR